MLITLWLCGFAMLAGFIDAVSGGGGLIQLPALFILRSDLPIPMLLGTNKLSSIAGTSMATATYLRKITINWPLLLPAVVAALIGSRLGSETTSLISPDVARPLMLVLLVAMALYTYFKPDLGQIRRAHPEGLRGGLIMLGIGGSIGFYDGFFGPGTGSLLVFLLVGLMGFDFLQATVNAKVLNFCTNLAALSHFIPSHLVLYSLAVPMAACNILGGLIGSHMALRRGIGFIRVVFLTVVIALIARYGYDIMLAMAA